VVTISVEKKQVKNGKENRINREVSEVVRFENTFKQAVNVRLTYKKLIDE
jgi:hypothetical protein